MGGEDVEDEDEEQEEASGTKSKTPDGGGEEKSSTLKTTSPTNEGKERKRLAGLPPTVRRRLQSSSEDEYKPEEDEEVGEEEEEVEEEEVEEEEEDEEDEEEQSDKEEAEESREILPPKKRKIISDDEEEEEEEARKVEATKDMEKRGAPIPMKVVEQPPTVPTPPKAANSPLMHSMNSISQSGSVAPIAALQNMVNPQAQNRASPILQQQLMQPIQQHPSVIHPPISSPLPRTPPLQPQQLSMPPRIPAMPVSSYPPPPPPAGIYYPPYQQPQQMYGYQPAGYPTPQYSQYGNYYVPPPPSTVGQGSKFTMLQSMPTIMAPVPHRPLLDPQHQQQPQAASAAVAATSNDGSFADVLSFAISHSDS